MGDFFVMAAQDFLNPLINLWNGFVYLLPGLVAALIILLIGYIIAWTIGHAIKLSLKKAGLDSKVAQARLTKAVGGIQLSYGIGEIVKWYIFIIFLQASVDLVNLGTLSIVLQSFVNWLPHLIAAIIILVGGLFLTRFVAHKVEDHTKIKGSKVLVQALQVVMMVMIGIIALDQIGIEVSLLKNGFLIILAAVCMGIALAFGLSFGLGNKEEANKIVKEVRKNL